MQARTLALQSFVTSVNNMFRQKSTTSFLANAVKLFNMRFFTQYCPNEQWFEEREKLETDANARLFDYTASRMFVKRGIAVSGNLYLVIVLSGKLYLAGKMEVGEVVRSTKHGGGLQAKDFFKFPTSDCKARYAA